MLWFFLCSGLFLGWSLGANDAANVFGTAVGTRMVRFRIAAAVASVCVLAGAVAGGSGTTATLGALGAVSAMGGAFTVALMAGVSVAFMNRTGIPVSTSQAVVGAIIGWNLFSGAPTDPRVLVTIVTAWAASPVIAAVVAVGLYGLVRVWMRRTQVHLLERDALTRAGLILVGAFGAYSLGANNIGNVMGVFVPVVPFGPFTVAGVEVSGVQQLFALGGLAIALGIWTDSYRVMTTVGEQLYKLTPVLAFVVVLAHSVTLFLFASTGLQALLLRAGLPPLPLVPVSSSQAIIGAILGVALVKGAGAGVRLGVLGRIAAGWLVTPVLAGGLCFVALFVMQNVFQIEVVALRKQGVSTTLERDRDVCGERQVVRREFGQPRPGQGDVAHRDVAGVVDVVEVQQREEAWIGATALEEGEQVDAAEALGQDVAGQRARPLVEVAEQDLRAGHTAVVHPRGEPLGLIAALEQRRPEVGVVHVQGSGAHIDRNPLHAARLAGLPGQVVLDVVPHGEAAQDHVAELVAAQFAHRSHDPAHAERGADALGVSGGRPSRANHLLERDDVGVERPQHVGDAFGTGAAVESAAAVDVIGDDPEIHGL